MTKKINFKALIISVLIPLGIGIIGTILGNTMEGYKQMNLPSFAPPGILFPIVWSILYILMGISAYLVYMSDSKRKGDAFSVYALSLVLNCLWTLIFFRFRLFLLAFIWLIAILIAAVIYSYLFGRIRKAAGYLQIPYILWLIFAGVLSYSAYILN